MVSELEGCISVLRPMMEGEKDCSKEICMDPVELRDPIAIEPVPVVTVPEMPCEIDWPLDSDKDGFNVVDDS